MEAVRVKHFVKTFLGYTVVVVVSEQKNGKRIWAALQNGIIFSLQYEYPVKDVNPENIYERKQTTITSVSTVQNYQQ